MTDLTALARRIDQLESRAAIAELVSAYAVACDEHDMPRLTELFTADAVYDSPNKTMVADGREEIVAMFLRIFKIRGPSYHWTHDHFVSFDPGDADRATGLVLGHAETCPDGVVSLAAMRYEDDYRRVEGRWCFARRVIKFLYYVPAQDYGRGLNSQARVSAGGSLVPADYPERLPAWQAFEREHKA